MRNKGNFTTVLLSLAIILIFLITIYFCLDIFEIIEIPEEYSISKIFSSKVEEIVPAGPIENIIPISNTSGDTIIVELDTKTQNTVEVTAPTFNNTTSVGQLTEQTYSYNNFYYDQLDEYGKIIYDKLYGNKDKLKTGKYTADFDTSFDDLLHKDNGSEILSNSFQLAVNALTFDNPEIFYIDVTKMYLLTEITTTIFKKTYRVSIGNNNNETYLSSEFSTEAIVNSAISKVNEEKEIIKGKILSENIETKLRTVHNYLVDNIEYDSTISKSNIYNIYGAIISKIAVCEGYSRAFKYLLDDLGIPCIIVCGMATNSNGETENHAWNYVQIEGKWYAIDVTWDDPIIIGYGKVADNIRYAYYLKGSNNFFNDHEEDGNIVADSNFVYPTLNAIDY